jgi:3-deoxy-D-manno-octulosonate 8-phosphate phosphatase (KDO 8-P phosphatase)
VLQDVHAKLPALEQLLRETGLKVENAAYIGDDLMDLPPMQRAGFSVAVVNAVEELKAHADYVTTRAGGDGAVREVIEYILKNSGRWDSLLDRYLA